MKQRIIKFNGSELLDTEDEIVTEFPLTIHLNSEEFATMVCSPTHIEEMVIGFLASEGVIRMKKEIKQLIIDHDVGFAYVDLHTPIVPNQKYFSKRFIGSCCGKSRQFYFQNDVKTAKTSMINLTVTAMNCIQLMNSMQEGSKVFKTTGGVHNAALATTQEIVVSRSDIGRHNAIDKLYGYCMVNEIPIKDKILVFSGRISSEILIKSAKIGVGIILSKSAPTDLAIKLATDLNITAVGFIRGVSFNVYSHPERIII
ncbi:formate dehydrogenase accessory sulfurtransferase FdhD [Litchfieldia salsa]|uniref:Sulfur carrier protein FdhD n=1 Tax=Litchfieldia salsa TaxID=930152 RepID=A0A1H0QAF7_9BACI|nr:formate dehydrogenase accessory sulfurtransferase FdhD [Litchfieldia salsa]SDP14170.1 FdhD protein [Litchfieldia salsa]